MSGNMTAEDVKKHVRTYWLIFGALLVLTFITVAIANFHLPVLQAVLLALAVASVKGSLVALFFMHLISEKTLIYWILGLTGFFFIFLIAIPWFL